MISLSLRVSRIATHKRGAASIPRVAGFFAENGSLRVNDAVPAVRRAAILETARGFMRAFPDMIVTCDKLERQGDRTAFHWTLTGTNTGPGGLGKKVRISGYELWMIDLNGLIAESKGHFDHVEYERQLEHGSDEQNRLGRFTIHRQPATHLKGQSA